MTFVLTNGSVIPHDQTARNVLGSCGGCHQPICAVIRHPNRIDPVQHPGAIRNDGLWRIDAIFPKPAPVEIPEAIPDSVAKAFKQGAESKKSGHFDAACGMYRRAMELGLKAFSPDIEAWKLEKRIDKMAADNRITQEIQSWAHELRLDGNEALHGDAEATQEMAEQMHQLCKFLLIYLYSLPAQVSAAKMRRGEI